MLSLSFFAGPLNFSIFSFGKQTPVWATDSLHGFLDIICSFSHHLHRWKFLTLFGVSRVLPVTLLPVLLYFWPNKQTLISTKFCTAQPVLTCVCVGGGRGREERGRPKCVLKKRPRIPYSMSPIQNWNVDHISRCHGKRYWVSVALTPGSHSEEPQSEPGHPRQGRVGGWGWGSGTEGEIGEETPNYGFGVQVLTLIVHS